MPAGLLRALDLANEFKVEIIEIEIANKYEDIINYVDSRILWYGRSGPGER